MSSASMTLYEVEDELLAWQNTLDLAETEEQRAEILAHVSAYLQLAAEKVDRFGQFLTHLEHLEFATKCEEDRLSKRRKGLVALRERLEEYAVRTMETLDRKKLEGNTSELRLAKNPDHVEILDESKIPLAYKVAPPPPPLKPDKAAIATAIKAGAHVPGADLVFGKNRLVRK